MLQRIVILNSVWEEYDEYYACDFSFNTDGYVAKWTEHMEYDYGDEYGSGDFTFTTDYNADGRIERLNISGKAEYYDPVRCEREEILTSKLPRVFAQKICPQPLRVLAG